MVSELDRWRAAAQLIKQGPEASLSAALRADEALDRGDVEGFHFWLDIFRKVRQLQRDKGPDIPIN